MDGGYNYSLLRTLTLYTVIAVSLISGIGTKMCVRISVELCGCMTFHLKTAHLMGKLSYRQGCCSVLGADSLLCISQNETDNSVAVHLEYILFNVKYLYHFALIIKNNGIPIYGNKQSNFFLNECALQARWHRKI